ncbi:transposase [Paraburkholderia sp. Cpub6]|uniref:transposase n=1 Tax=Paraburkholderia sp. Cpub6 TaxID=2723094 RepID=UPI00160E07B9|nr:transposase [Paraburkholderia sp. Cpub6]
MKLTPVGIDIAKTVFQVHYVDEDTGEIVNKPIKRAALLEHFANRLPCLIGTEACGGAHHWARTLVKMGHQVKLMPGEFVKAFNIRNKTRGDTYLRTLLIHGARSVLINAKEPGAWVEQLKKRRHPNVVIVALANRMARTIWAVLANDRPFEKGYVSIHPAEVGNVS